MKPIVLFPFAVLVLAAGCGEDALTEPGVVTTADPALNTTAGEDVTAPELVEFDFDPKTIDVTGGPAQVTVTVRITDDLSGLDFCKVRFHSPSQAQSGTVFLTAGNRLSGDALDGVYENDLSFPQFSESGIWFVDLVFCTDAVGNNLTLREPDLLGSFPTKLEVFSVLDVDPPELVEFDFDPKTIDVTGGPAQVTVTVRITDDLSGLDFCKVRFHSPSQAQSGTVFLTAGNRLSGDALDGVYENDLSFPQFSESGIWFVDLVFCTDAVGNNLTLREPDLLGSFPTELIVGPLETEVDIDIKPGSDPNSINCNNENETITVAILTTDDFDATTVDHTTVTFQGASETHVDKKTGVARRHEEDVDGDGDTDLVLHFRLGDTDLDCGSTDGTLTGETFDGQMIEGADAVRMIDEGGGPA